MIEMWATRRPARLCLVGCMLAGGFVAAVLLLHEGKFATATALFAIGQAALVGTGKLASP